MDITLNGFDDMLFSYSYDDLEYKFHFFDDVKTIYFRIMGLWATVGAKVSTSPLSVCQYVQYDNEMTCPFN